MDRRLAAVLAVSPYVVLAGVLRQLPDLWSHPAPMPWSHAAGNTLLFLGLMAWHSWSYARWQPHAPNRMLVNEFLTRLWFVLFGLIAVGAVGPFGGVYLVMAAPWAVASWCTHYLVLRQHDRYDAPLNVGLLGLFLLGLALMGLVCLSL